MNKFADIFGLPNTGVHKYRLFGIAIVDLIFTILFAIILYYVFKINIIVSILILLLLGIILHRIFRVNTAANLYIFGKV